MRDSNSTLADEIRRLYALAQNAAADAVARASEAIAAVIACGSLLITAKESVRQGDWLAWLESHCPDIHRSTANRYMALAAKSKHLDFECARSIRQAYVMAELIPEPDPVDRAVGNEPAPYLVHVARLERAITQSLSRRPIEIWSPDERRMLRARLEPFVTIYRRLESEPVL